jgi:hypothetical protein
MNNNTEMNVFGISSSIFIISFAKLSFENRKWPREDGGYYLLIKVEESKMNRDT